MSEENDDKDRGAWWVFGLGGVGALSLLIGYLRFRSGFAVGTLEAHAQLGDALGPVVAFLTLFTVVAALWSVQIQRIELALQRQELRETREEMVEQRKQFERTAKAQEKLADAQQESAKAQARANQLSARLLRRSLGAQAAQRGNTQAILAAALASMSGTMAISRREMVASPGVAESLVANVNRLSKLLEAEQLQIEGINDALEEDAELHDA